MSLSSSSPFHPERGSALIFILLAIVLFAALSYAISRDDSGIRNLSQEKIRLLASEIIDTGNRFSESASRMRLHGIKDTQISFEYSGNFINAACTDDSCKVFAFDGGGMEWETPPTGANGGEPWGFTGDLAIQNIGTDSADLVAILPNLSADVCHRINVLLGLDAEDETPPSLGATIAPEFTGSYNGSPVAISHARLNGQKSGCFLSDLSGSSVPSVAGGTPIYIFYQVLAAR